MRAASALNAFLDRPEPARRLGPFHLIRQLGRGGSAPVWLASETYGDVEIRSVAVKLFAPDAGPPRPPGDPQTDERRVRIIEEARLLCSVEHPNIVRLYRLLIDEEPGIVGLVMEHVEGASLAQRIRGRDKLPLADVLSIGAAVASALSAVHRAGLVHRDVKPANILDARGTVKLIDFGIASFGARPHAEGERSVARRVRIGDLPTDVLGAEMSELTGAVTLVDEGDGPARSSEELLPSGTVGYIDPVCVAEGVPATPASDLYALGVTLFECISGKLPSVVAAADRGGLRGEVLDGREAAPPLADVAPGVPPGLAKLVDAMLAPTRDRRPRSAERVSIELERLRSGLVGRTRHLPGDEVGPFRGLGRFEEDDRDVFFGRSADVAAAVEMLRSRGLVAIVGASGSGKSSLVRAGIAPLVAEGSLGGWIKRWDVRLTSPGVDARAAITTALSDLVPVAPSRTPEQIAAALASRAESESVGTLLIIDQLEELVTVCSEDAASWASGLLAVIADAPVPGVRALVAARRDLLDPLLALSGLGRALPRGLLQLVSIGDEAWREIMEQALDAYGYDFENEGLCEEVLRQLRDTHAGMPLVQFALTELWQQRDRNDRKITRAGLLAIGGIGGALERHADATLRELAQDLPREQVREVLLAMTTVQGTRAERTVEELTAETGPAVQAIVDALEAARLVVRGEAGLTLAHETLLSQWGTLRQWLADSREARSLAKELEQASVRYLTDKDDSLLWKKRRLIAAEDLARSGLVKLSDEARSFVRRARVVDQRGRIAVGLTVLILAAVATTGISVYVQDTRAAKAEADRNAEAARVSEARAQEKAELAQRDEQKARESEAKAVVAEQESARLGKQFQGDLEELRGELAKARTQADFEIIKKRIRDKEEAQRRVEGTPLSPGRAAPSSASKRIEELVGSPP